MTSEILTVRPQPGAVLVVAGEIDRDSRQRLRDAADEALRQGANRLVLDLSAVTFCDSSGLSLFIDVHRQCAARGGDLRLAAASPALLDMLRVTRLDRLFPPYDTVEAATGRP